MTDFDVDAYLAKRVGRERFRFRLGGRERSLPHVFDLTLRQQQRVDEGDWDVFAELGDQDLADALQDLPGDAVGELRGEWLKHAGMNLGESAASSS